MNQIFPTQKVKKKEKTEFEKRKEKDKRLSVLGKHLLCSTWLWINYK